MLSANHVAGFSNQPFSNQIEQNNEIARFLHGDTNSWKCKVDLKIFGWAWSKKVPKICCISNKGIGGITVFWHAITNFRKL